MPLRNFLNFRRNHEFFLLEKPARERHLISVVCSVLSIVCIIVSLSLKQWAVSGSSKCDCTFGLTKVYCVNGEPPRKCDEYRMTDYYHTSHEILISCVLSISVLTIISSSVAVVVSSGYPREKLEFLRHYSVFNIVSLLCILLVSGFWLAVVNSLPIKETKEYKDTVNYGYGFYVYVCSGFFTLVAICVNLLLAKTAAERRRQHRHRFRNRVLLANSATQNSPSPTSFVNEDADNPPDYTEATTSFMEGDNEREEASDTDQLVNPPPPYAP